MKVVPSESEAWDLVVVMVSSLTYTLYSLKAWTNLLKGSRACTFTRKRGPSPNTPSDTCSVAQRRQSLARSDSQAVTSRAVTRPS